jgi:hypothetical protein
MRKDMAKYMDWQHKPVRHMPNPDNVNKQQLPDIRQVPSPAHIPGKQDFLDKPEFPAPRQLPRTLEYFTEWIHTRQGFVQPRKNIVQRFVNRVFGNSSFM